MSVSSLSTFNRSLFPHVSIIMWNSKDVDNCGTSTQQRTPLQSVGILHTILSDTVKVSCWMVTPHSIIYVKNDLLYKSQLFIMSYQINTILFFLIHIQKMSIEKIPKRDAGIPGQAKICYFFNPFCIVILSLIFTNVK